MFTDFLKGGRMKKGDLKKDFSNNGCIDSCSILFYRAGGKEIENKKRVILKKEKINNASSTDSCSLGYENS
jgi:hypothetical protein